MYRRISIRWLTFQHITISSHVSFTQPQESTMDNSLLIYEKQASTASPCTWCTIPSHRRRRLLRHCCDTALAIYGGLHMVSPVGGLSSTVMLAPRRALVVHVESAGPGKFSHRCLLFPRTRAWSNAIDGRERGPSFALHNLCPKRC